MTARTLEKVKIPASSKPAERAILNAIREKLTNTGVEVN